MRSFRKRRTQREQHPKVRRDGMACNFGEICLSRCISSLYRPKVNGYFTLSQSVGLFAPIPPYFSPAAASLISPSPSSCKKF